MNSKARKKRGHGRSDWVILNLLINDGIGRFRATPIGFI